MAYSREKVDIKSVQLVSGPDIWAVDKNLVDRGDRLIITDPNTHQFHSTASIVEYEKAGTNAYAIDADGHVYTNSKQYLEMFKRELEQTRQQENLLTKEQQIAQHVLESGKAPFRIVSHAPASLMIERDGQFEPIEITEAERLVRHNAYADYPERINLALDCSMIDLNSGSILNPQPYRLNSVERFHMGNDGSIYFETDSMICTTEHIEHELGVSFNYEKLWDQEPAMKEMQEPAMKDTTTMIQCVANSYLDTGKLMYSMTEYNTNNFMRLNRATGEMEPITDWSQVQLGDKLALGDCLVIDVNDPEKNGYVNGRIGSVEDIRVDEHGNFAIVSRSAIFTNVDRNEFGQALQHARFEKEQNELFQNHNDNWSQYR